MVEKLLEILLEDYPIIFIFLSCIFIFYKLFNERNIFIHKIKDKKIKKFINFLKNKKNFKNKLYSENIFLYMFDYYISYEVLIRLVKLENPTGAILRYINSGVFLTFIDNKLVFKNKYLNKKNMRQFYFILNFILGITFFIIAFLIFSYIITIYKDEKLMTVIIYSLYTLIFFSGFILSIRNSIKVKDAENIFYEFKNNEEIK